MDFIIHKLYDIAKRVVLASSVFLLTYVVIKYLVPFFAPFITAGIIASINEPAVSFLEKHKRLSRSVSALVSLLFTISIFGSFIVFGILKTYNELMIFQENLSGHIKNFSEQLSNLTVEVSKYYNSLPDPITGAIRENLLSLTPKLEIIMKSIASHLIGIITSIPKTMLFMVVTFIASYFISRDKYKIRSFIYKKTPDRWLNNFSRMKTRTFLPALAYFKTLLVLLPVTFLETIAGLLFIKADYVFLISVIIALSGAVPFLGTGIVLVPWITWQLVTGNIGMALGLTVIYLLIIITNQIIEPNILKNKTVLHPLEALASVYVGVGVFGIPGLFIGPASVIVAKNISC